METPKEYYYTYYSYEEWGRGYIGSRGCECLPEEDIRYFGSYSDKTFHPTEKIILGIYETREEAIAAEIILHNFYDVANNPHFVNKAKQTSTKFSYIVPREEAIKNGKKSYELGLGVHGLTPEQRRKNSSKSGKIGGKITANKNKKEKKGIFGLTTEQRVENGKIAGKRNYELGVGVHSRTKEQMSEDGKKWSARAKELCVGIFGMTPEEKSAAGKKAKELGVGIFGLSPEQRSENSKKGGKIGGKIGGNTNKKNKTGVCGRTKEQMNEDGKKGGKKSKELGLGFHALTKEERSEIGKRQKELELGIHGLTKEQRSENGRKGAKKVCAQKWECTETGYIANPGNLSKYQKKRGIDTSKRSRIL